MYVADRQVLFRKGIRFILSSDEDLEVIEDTSSWKATDIDLNLILLNNAVPAITDPQYGFVTDPNTYLTDIDGDGITERMVKFDREAIKQLVNVGEDLEQVPGGLQGERSISAFTGMGRG